MDPNVLGSLVLPNTDAAAVVEVIVAGAFLASALVLTWRHAEWRLLVLGVTVCVFAFLALRALH